MMFESCPACGAPDSVADDGPFSETCTCEDCGAQFEIEPDADCNGESYQDCSTVGKRIDV